MNRIINLWTILDKELFKKLYKNRIEYFILLKNFDWLECEKEVITILNDMTKYNDDLQFDFSQVDRKSSCGDFIFKLTYKGEKYKVSSSYGSCDYCCFWTEQENVDEIVDELEIWFSNNEEQNKQVLKDKIVARIKEKSLIDFQQEILEDIANDILNKNWDSWNIINVDVNEIDIAYQIDEYLKINSIYKYKNN